jgi:hypothetical protein
MTEATQDQAQRTRDGGMGVHLVTVKTVLSEEEHVRLRHRALDARLTVVAFVREALGFPPTLEDAPMM